MYKITIEKTVGEVTKKTTIETEDVELVKSVLSAQEVTSVHSDVDNLNINPEWQELMQWYRKHKEVEEKELEQVNKFAEEMKKINDRAHNRGDNIYISPFTSPGTVGPFVDPSLPWASPFTITC